MQPNSDFWNIWNYITIKYFLKTQFFHNNERKLLFFVEKTVEIRSLKNLK